MWEFPELPSGKVIGQWLAFDEKGIGGGRLHTACCMGGAEGGEVPDIVSFY